VDAGSAPRPHADMTRGDDLVAVSGESAENETVVFTPPQILLPAACVLAVIARPEQAGRGRAA
jgi:hypothetical protein